MMYDLRFSWVQPVRRRSVLAVFAAVATALANTRRSNAAERSGSREDVKGSLRSAGAARGNQVPTTVDLKMLGPEQQVISIVGSAGGYAVTTVSGRGTSFAEFDLRFKTDSSAHGPIQGHPVLIPASMRNDRAFVVFADVREIGAFVSQGTERESDFSKFEQD